METHVAVQGGYVLELAMTEIALDWLLDLYDVQQMRIESRHELLTELLLLDLIRAGIAHRSNQISAILHGYSDILCIVELKRNT